MEDHTILNPDFVNQPTEQKQLFEALRILLENSVHGTAILRDGQIIFANPVMAETLGYTIDELKAIHPEEIYQLIHPDDHEAIACGDQAYPSGDHSPRHLEIRFKTRNGDIRWLDYTSAIILTDGKSTCYVAILDITNRKYAQRALETSEEHYRLMLENYIDGIFEVNASGSIVYLNDNCATLCGYEKGEVLNQNIGFILDEENLNKISLIMDKTEPGNIFADETYLIHKDGRRIYVSFSVLPIEKAGRPTYTGIVKEISEQKEMIEALRKSEQHYKTLIEASQDYIFVINRDDTIEFVNDCAAREIDATPEELIGKARSSYFQPFSNEQQTQYLREVFQTGVEVYAEHLTEYLNHELWMSTWFIPLKDSSGRVNSVLGISRDISQLKLMENSLLDLTENLDKRISERTASLAASQKRAQKLSEKLVKTEEDERLRIARVLHDETMHDLILIKYELDAILNAMPQRQAANRAKISQTLDMIERMGEKIHDLSHSLRPSLLDVGGINMTLKELCQSTSDRTDLIVRYRGVELIPLPEDISICLYRFAQEGLTNVLKHAGATQANVTLQHRNGHIRLSVSDNGCGVDPTRLDRGLGFLGMRERLDLLGGAFEIKSQPQTGTNIIAKIPWGDKEII